jgi:hypothetical protein
MESAIMLIETLEDSVTEQDEIGISKPYSANFLLRGKFLMESRHPVKDDLR